MFRVAVSGRREQEPSFFTVIVWRDQAEHAAESLIRGSRSVVEVVAEELGPSLRWATATTSRATRTPPPRGSASSRPPEDLWVQRGTSPDEWNWVFVPASNLYRLLNRELP
jgi:single-strand DNA-binding protein